VLPECPGRWAGLLAEWRQDRDAGGWQGRVVNAVDDGRATVMVEAWVHARHLQPAGD
jgi:SH3-like domain-containing protein